MVRGTPLRAAAVPVLALILIVTAVPATTHPHHPGSDPGSIQGSVIDESFAPVGGALMTLSQDGKLVAQAHTDAQGTYALEEIEPGTYLLEASKEGFFPQQTNVAVQSGEVSTVNFLLSTEGPTPWVDGPNDWYGFISCWVSTTEPCQHLDPNHGTLHTTVFEEGLRTITASVFWETHPALGADELRFQIRTGQGVVLADVTGGSPLEVRIDDKFIGPEALIFEAVPTETSLVYQQQFTVFWTFHYWEHAPDGYSSLPDHL